jgi:CRP/FNR family cyclic AMP-dependent transcriptional regulator
MQSMRVYRSGEPLFVEGEMSQSMFIIKKGGVSIRKRKGSNFVEIGKVTTNEVIGELSFFDRLPRSATAVALGDVEAIELPFEALEKVYNSIPDYLKTIMASMANRLRKSNDLIRSLQKERTD